MIPTFRARAAMAREAPALHPTRRAFAMLALIVSVAGISGCRTTSGATALTTVSEPPSSSAWPTALIAAQSDVDQGRYADADRALVAFALDHEGSPEARETGYWRAVFMLDPANTTASPSEAATLLDHYLSRNAPLTHRSEATILQRVAKSLATPRETAGPPRPADPAREAELKALKDELEKTKAELERIKKRLATPPTTTPPPPLADAE
jgi:hypothetical protein